MKKLSKRSLAVAIAAFLAVVLALVLPSIYIQHNKTLILGIFTTFSGNVSYNGYNAHIGFSIPLFIAWLLPLIAGILAIVFGQNQKSTYFFTFCLFIASAILYSLTMKYFTSINVAGAIGGFQTAELCAQPYVVISLNAIGAIASLFAMFYKPSKRRY